MNRGRLSSFLGLSRVDLSHRLTPGSKSQRRFMIESLCGLTSAVALSLCCQACGSSPENAVQQSPKIKIMMLSHIDPTDAMRYSGHRDAFLWFQQLARDKGFKISAAITGSYADMAVREGHLSDFADFMPGKSHILGSHIHPEYKGATDVGVAGQWTQISDFQNADEATVQTVFNDNIGWANKIFTGLGAAATDNHLFHATQMNMAKPLQLLGAEQPNSNSYRNVFDLVGDGRGLHPYRTACPNFCPDVTNPVAADILKPFVAVPIEGEIWMTGQHIPDGMVHGTLPYQQRDMILVYLEYWYHGKTGARELPWVFGSIIHPHDMDMIHPYPGINSRENRAELPQFYDWLNQNFVGDIAEYANYQEVAEEYKAWEAKNPSSQIYQDEDSTVPGLQAELADVTQAINHALRDGVFYYVRMERSSDTLIVEFANDQSQKAVLVMPGKSHNVNLDQYFSGNVKVVGCAQTTDAVALADVKISTGPVLLVGR
jgi:hypothetical protein